MNRYTLLHLGARLAYNYLYVTAETRRGSYWRTLVFQFSIYPSIAIIFRAARALA